MKLSDAIRYSIRTPGMTLYKKLKEKEGEFPYLRITLGPNQRTAPGIPYVLEIWPAGEDFAYFSQEIPSCFYRLGIRNEAKGITSMLHTPTFDIDESALEIGCGLMAFIAIDQLSN